MTLVAAAPTTSMKTAAVTIPRPGTRRPSSWS